MKKIDTPLTQEIVETLHAGDLVLVNGYVYTARDAAHKRLVELIKDDLPLPLISMDRLYTMLDLLLHHLVR